MRFDTVVNLFIAHSIEDGLITIHGRKQFTPLVHVRDATEAKGHVEIINPEEG